MAIQTRMHFIVFCRDNKVETLVAITQNTSEAHMRLIDTLDRCLVDDPERRVTEVAALMADFASNRVVDNVTIAINDELNLQFFTENIDVIIDT
jgi:hypothetical protein